MNEWKNKRCFCMFVAYRRPSWIWTGSEDVTSGAKETSSTSSVLLDGRIKIKIIIVKFVLSARYHFNVFKRKFDPTFCSRLRTPHYLLLKHLHSLLQTHVLLFCWSCLHFYSAESLLHSHIYKQTQKKTKPWITQKWSRISLLYLYALPVELCVPWRPPSRWLFPSRRWAVPAPPTSTSPGKEVSCWAWLCPRRPSRSPLLATSMYSSVIWVRGQSCGAEWYGVSMGELGGESEESEEREESEVRDCGVSWERFGPKAEPSLLWVSRGRR